jgi:hypothetical protein
VKIRPMIADRTTTASSATPMTVSMDPTVGTVIMSGTSPWELGSVPRPGGSDVDRVLRGTTITTLIGTVLHLRPGVIPLIGV